ncbi:hypothetical protein ACU686_25955 [Yinghuangia aomiensis]
MTETPAADRGSAAPHRRTVLRRRSWGDFLDAGHEFDPDAGPEIGRPRRPGAPWPSSCSGPASGWPTWARR